MDVKQSINKKVPNEGTFCNIGYRKYYQMLSRNLRTLMAAVGTKLSKDNEIWLFICVHSF